MPKPQRNPTHQTQAAGVGERWVERGLTLMCQFGDFIGL